MLLKKKVNLLSKRLILYLYNDNCHFNINRKWLNSPIRLLCHSSNLFVFQHKRLHITLYV